MNKGCIIALVVTFVLVAVAAIVVSTKVFPWMQKLGTAGIVYGTEIAIEGYTDKYGNPPAGETHTEIIEAVTGGNEDKRDFFPPDLSQAIIDGQVHDGYGNPLVIQREGKGIIRVFSTGKDGAPDTEDDVTSDAMPEEMKAEFRRKMVSP
ncbi:MAG: hypothetical protein AAF591_11780 [Verrucomicrobiota bacterium]